MIQNFCKIDFLFSENSQLTNCPEAYTLIDNFKCYALNDPNHQLYAVYNQAMPTYALRGATKTCYNILLNIFKQIL